jgi:hypothetical protein
VRWPSGGKKNEALGKGAEHQADTGTAQHPVSGTVSWTPVPTAHHHIKHGKHPRSENYCTRITVPARDQQQGPLAAQQRSPLLPGTPAEPLPPWLYAPGRPSSP